MRVVRLKHGTAKHAGLPAGTQDIKRQYASASVLKGGRVVFNICGNRYRLVVRINYPQQIVFIRFVGTHTEYDAIDAEAV